MDINNTTLVICGPFNKNTIRMVNNYKDIFKEIVISTYKNDDLLFKKLKKINNLKIIENDILNIDNLHNSQNIYSQCFSVFNGLNIVSNKYSIKLRSDEYYSNLDKVIPTLPKQKITTSNIFVRDIHYKPFHLSDHIIIGNSKVLRNSFFNLMEYIKNVGNGYNDKLSILTDRIPSETKITLFILFELEEKSFLNWDKLDSKMIYKLLVKNFNLLDIDILFPYIIKASAVGEILDYKKFIHADLKLGLRYVNSIEKLYPRNIFQRFLDKKKTKFKKYWI